MISTTAIIENPRDAAVLQLRAIDECIRAVTLLSESARFTADVSNIAPDSLKKVARLQRAVYESMLIDLRVKRSRVRL